MLFRSCATTTILLLAAGRVVGQTAEQHLAIGDSLWEALAPEASLEHYLAAITMDPSSADGWWKYARSQVDVAKQLMGDEFKDTRDSVYAIATAYAQEAVLADSLDPDTHFALALALGQLSRTRGGKERVKFARQIYDASARALQLAPDHDGAEHIIGAWHAEVMRLSGISKFFAKTLFGGGFLDRGSMDSAAAHLERAVELKPSYVFHHLELAEIYVDLKRFEDAERHLEAVAPLSPTSDVLDDYYKERSARLLDDLRARRR